jgi:hypothetical protein
MKKKLRFVVMTRILILSFIVILSFNSYSQNSVSIRDLKNGRHLSDSSPIYELPFLPKKSVLLIQGYQSIFSHKNQYASDFKVNTGSKIFAARDGIVVKAKEDSKIGGLGRKFLNKGNHVIIMHSDSTCAA